MQRVEKSSWFDLIIMCLYFSVMPGHRAWEDARGRAYVPGIHVFEAAIAGRRGWPEQVRP
jgi:hypothetical protein